MKMLNVKKLGLAFAVTATLLYVGCIILMAIAGKGGTVYFFNSLLHGLNVESIIRMDVPLIETLLGIVLTFVLGWLSGALVAAIYNNIGSQKV
ncbi:DUF5676 family membrane protein [Fodinibius halophilus]|uniref:Uncharacterized protein n=1 Tax=Fodinibius halophilus TaxID=1736908 RepID=A0A6M1TDP4_9BACT|nr:DUF5676 family membrane protein [Fodinibius halophilus]NGP90131.1 hypothetical protein [Fodinibius halophilus]